MKISNLFVALATAFVNIGELKKANLYDDFATLECVSGGKKFKISISCEGDTDGNKNN